ncbi:PTS sugar transporter subunit IIC [Nitratireductor aquimarinus]|uniref:PTS transporter subunit IIC n=1 Tax=Nitratireductor aquimarinus TaxID=889300 RepID=A0ABU4AP35_9HYPH|nr:MULTISPECIES: PTS transporter subunit IIC [Alphaproteobacteria]MBY6020347.1 PTS sugar transporter subunit IIC [Nitratireductor sp. DP7N14-4]MBN7755561.1 PTS sugar transporter subunit IIC [Nitratireductor aquimarinus]MBN7763360.1 PTS sugar transporter subunit IIC [Nitratireductor aquibiodomus]MBN7775919.1 PTS sugar transporter subunit IIC [Nitratireductor pacificus]MBN7780582.1 PTS sugar transporter subunit IIC [Nitratireductor pacificus]
MDAFLSGLKTAVDTLGATVLLPIVIFVIAVVLGAKVGKAFRAAVTIGVAFIGINLVLGLMLGSIGDVAQAIVTNTGIQRDIVDVGWPSAAAIAFGSSVGLWVIPIGIAVNIVLLLTRMTRTLNVDVWNFWHFAFIGSLAVAATGSLGYGLVITALMAALSLLFADWSARAVQKFYGIPGVSVPHLASAQILPIAIVVNWIIERIPGVNKINISTETIERRFGVFGEPVVLGLVIGLVLGAIGYYNAGDFGTVLSKVLQTGMTLAAVMLLLPRMVKILMEGLLPVSEAAQEFVRKRTGDRELLVGLDSAILIGHPAAISSSLILVPIAIALSVILPGNRVILFADLAVIPFIVAMAAPLMRGNVFRMVIVGTVTLAVGFYVANALAPLFTSAAIDSGFEMPENAVQITSVVDGFLWISYVVIAAIRDLGVAGLGLLAALIAACFWLYRRNTQAWERAAGAEDDTAQEG